MTRLLLSFLAILLAACTAAVPPEPARVDGKAPLEGPVVPMGGLLVDDGTPRVDPRTAVQNFVTVVEAVKPVAEAACRARGVVPECDYRIVVDDAVNAPPNAFQTLDDAGNPVIAFTLPLIAEARNQDELAFIMAHEAAHHILGHLQQTRRNAAIGAGTLGRLAQIANPGNANAIDRAAAIGAEIGARTYSKDFELEADALGARIAIAAGFDPVRGVAFFNRIPDPGNRFLGTHPANADRIALVQQVASGG